MLGNYLKVALRNLAKHRTYALINIAGLALGAAVCVLALLYARHEWGYDDFHERGGRIYRVYAEYDIGGEVRKGAGLPIQLAALVEGLPQVERAVRLCAGRNQKFDHREVRVVRDGEPFEEQFLLADPDFFAAFTFPLQKGDPETALVDPHSVVLSAEMARKYFGDEDPLGRRLSIRSVWNTRQYRDFTVTGVAAPLPPNSTIRFGLLLPFANVDFLFRWNAQFRDYNHTNADLYVLLAPGAEPGELAAGLAGLATAHGWWSAGESATLRPQALADMHFGAEVESWIRHGTEPASDPFYSYVLAAVALLVLAIACVNFINLSLGRALARFREVGVRRMVGARRRQVAGQLLGEALLTAALALGAGSALAELALPVFAELTGRQLALDWGAAPWLLALALLIGAGAGLYPAWALSAVEPVAVVKGRAGAVGVSGFSRALVVGQFAASVMLIVCALVMVGQLDYALERDLGFNEEHLVVMRADQLREIGSPRAALRRNLLQHPGIAAVSEMRYPLIWADFGKVALPAGLDSVRTQQLFVDYDFVAAMELDVIRGRDFDQDAGDLGSGGVIVNEALVELMGWAEPIGQQLAFAGQAGNLLKHSAGTGTVVGVVRDYHFWSLHHQVAPASLILNPAMGKDSDVFMVRVRSEGLQQTLAHMAAAWREVAPDRAFRYSFFDEDLARAYQDERRWGAIVRYAAGLAVLVACMGALGLSMLAASRRTKEIGIRKVLGATAAEIAGMLVGDLARLVLVANALAWPLAYWITGRWLRQFAYRIELGADPFLLAGGIALGLVVGVAGWQALRAARVRPVESLRYE